MTQIENEAWEDARRSSYVVSCGDSRWVQTADHRMRPGRFRAQSIRLTGEPPYSTTLGEN